jgi:DNA-binding NtrC family response regulator
VEKKAEMGQKLALAMTQMVLPPVDADKVEATIKKCLKSLNVSEENQKTILPKVREAVLKEGVKSASMADLEKAVATVLKSENLETDEAEGAKKVNQALRKSIEPPGIVFADTNWGGGDHHTVFSMVTNPITDALEMWQMAEDGSSPKKLDEKKWVTATWKMPKSPDSFGGV